MLNVKTTYTLMEGSTALGTIHPTKFVPFTAMSLSAEQAAYLTSIFKSFEAAKEKGVSITTYLETK